MAELTLDQATALVTAVLAESRDRGLKPLTVAVVDSGGHLKAFARQDGSTGTLRPEIAVGKACGAVGMGMSSRRLEKLAGEKPHFVQALVGASGGRLIPVPGGVLIRDLGGNVLGGIGVTGDKADNDEEAAVAGIRAIGLAGES